MEFLFDHAKEIMMLCFGVGFLVFTLFASILIYRVHRLITKIDDLIELINAYIYKPVTFILKLEKTLKKFSKFFEKK